MSVTSCLILGSGSLGTALANAFVQDGVDVHVIRKTKKALAPPIRTAFWDIRDASQAPNLAVKADVGYVILSPPERTAQAYSDLYIAGLGNFLNFLSGHQLLPNHLVFVSSTSVFGDQHGAWVTEDTEPSPANFRGETLLQAEKILEIVPTKTTAVRFSGIYSTTRSKRLRSYASGNYDLQANPQSWMNMIHEEDCVGILRWLATQDSPASIYIGADTCPTIKREYYRWVAQKLGIPEPIWHPPSHATPEKRCSSEKLLKEGFRFRYPSYREGLEDVLQELLREKNCP